VEGEEGRGWEVSGVGNPANSTHEIVMKKKKKQKIGKSKKFIHKSPSKRRF